MRMIRQYYGNQPVAETAATSLLFFVRPWRNALPPAAVRSRITLPPLDTVRKDGKEKVA